jgi:hypothetical protein
MSCYISSGVDLGCSDGIGGIKSIWVLGKSGNTLPSVTGLTYSGGTAQVGNAYGSTNEPITGISGSGAWYNFELKRNTSSLSQNTTKNFENGTIFWEQVLTAVLYKYDQDKRNQLLLLGQNDQIQIIAQDQNDIFYYLGQVNGMYLSGGSAASGTAFGDRNGFELIFTGQESQPANVIDDASAAALQATLIAGGFGVA